MRSLKLFVAVALAVCVALPARAQFRSTAGSSSAPSGVIDQSTPSFLFGWFDASKFSMRHSVSFSVMSFPGQSMTLGTYTNTMRYQFATNLDARADISMSYSPGNSFSGFNGKTNNDFSGVYLSNAQINYRPWDNTVVQFQYRRIPYGTYSPFSGYWYRDDGF
jgi:hypothetical protein